MLGIAIKNSLIHLPLTRFLLGRVRETWAGIKPLGISAPLWATDQFGNLSVDKPAANAKGMDNRPLS